MGCRTGQTVLDIKHPPNPQIGFYTLSEYVLAKKETHSERKPNLEIPTINTRPIIHPAMVATTRMRRGRMVPVLHSV